MKRIKMLKWKIGILGAIGIAILFSGIKASPEFQQAYASASSAASAAANQSRQQDASNDNQYSNNQNDIFGQGNTSQFNDYNQSSGDSSNQAQSPMPRAHTKTRRS